MRPQETRSSVRHRLHVYPRTRLDVGDLDREDSEEIADWLVESGHLKSDGGMLFIEPEAGHRFGPRNFMDHVSVFTANPEFTVLQGRPELGSVDPVVLTREAEGPRIIVLAARSWEVTYIPARMKWMGDAAPLSCEMCPAQRDVLLSSDPEVVLSQRAVAGFQHLREEHGLEASDRGLVLLEDENDRVVVDEGRGSGQRDLARRASCGGGPNQRVGNFRLRLVGRDAIDELSATARHPWTSPRPRRRCRRPPCGD